MRVAKQPTSHRDKVTIISLALIVNLVEAQVVSHELRKLAVASNQFGIDALRALDRIEPPDKVIVFSPICLTASLSMVMMGSSKYQVVSSLRHALYVWSMKPQDINRAYRDLFDHIGMNQPSSQHQLSLPMKLPKKNSTSARSLWWQDERRGLPSAMSLPKLVKLREAAEHSGSAWWSNETKLERKSGRDQQPTGPEFSQMNSLSSVYIQRGLHMNYNYNLLLRDYYKTVVHPVDFVRNGEETRQHINSLVASRTEGKVKDLMKRQSFEGRLQLPRALIVSTFHFRGTLDVQMKQTPSVGNKSHKRAQRDNISAGQIYIQTEPTLLKYGKFKRGLDCTCIEIPFSNRLISLIILTPNNANSTDLLLTKLSAQVLSDMQSSLAVRQISLEIPVIKFGRGPTNVLGLLRELSLNGTFFGGDTFSTSTETGLNRWLRAEDIVHETSIDIGTAVQQEQAQTEDRLKVGAHWNEAKRRRGDRKLEADERHLKLDKSFFYFISDSINGLVLAMGRIKQ